MKTSDRTCDPDRLSKLELISLYINEYYSLDADTRARFEAAFMKRNIPLPELPRDPPAASPARKVPSVPMDKSIFLSYILLIYTGTAIFYSWFYLVQRIIKRDFRHNTKHRLIQSGIALLYVFIEFLVYDRFFGAD